MGRGIKDIVAHELVSVAVERTCTRLGLGLDGAGGVAAILCAVVGGQHAHFANGLDTGSNVQRGVAAVIHVVAAIQLPVVIFEAAAVYAVVGVSVNADHTLRGAGLIADPGS